MSDNKFRILNHQVKVFIINGMGTAGKDEFAKAVNVAMMKATGFPDNEKHSYLIKLSSVDYPKQVCKYCGWYGGKTEKDRKFISDINLALEEWNNSPLQTVLDKIEFSINNTKDREDCEQAKYFFVDIREPYRIDKFKNMCKQLNYQVFTVFIRRPGIPQITSNVADAFTLKPYDYDYYLDNDGTLEEWYEKSAKFAKEIILGIKEGD